MNAIHDLRPPIPAADAPNAIEVEHIVKKYGDFTAVDDVSFTVKADINGQTRVTTYTGTLSGDEWKVKQTREGRNGPQTSEYTLKRATT